MSTPSSDTIILELLHRFPICPHLLPIRKFWRFYTLFRYVHTFFRYENFGAFTPFSDMSTPSSDTKILEILHRFPICPHLIPIRKFWSFYTVFRYVHTLFRYAILKPSYTFHTLFRYANFGPLLHHFDTSTPYSHEKCYVSLLCKLHIKSSP